MPKWEKNDIDLTGVRQITNFLYGKEYHDCDEVHTVHAI